MSSLEDTLQNSENLPVFKPTDKAFMKMPRKSKLTKLAKKTALSSVICYHLVGDK